ncbi:sigma-70 family RNA polymerase sigma factor [Bacillus cytotoxicus]|uniref:sigma-70 family RNA polymerase sigma factor n=5 Tax=Bacillus cereus group TaxID=86661 RepID=UPI0035C9F9D2
MDKEIKNVREMSDEEFMKKYERLVHHCVWRRYGKKLNSIKNDTALDIEDLTQFGMIGLIKARKQFNTEYGCQFSTYAVPKIFGEIGRAIRDHQKVRTQRIVYDIKGKIIRQKLEGKTPVEISEILGEPVNLVKIALKYQPSTLSMDQVIYDSGNKNGKITLEQTLEERNKVNIENETVNQVVLKDFLSTLQHTEYIVLDMHFKNMTQQKIGNKVGVSQVQISRILQRIHNKAEVFGRERGFRK